MCSGKVIRLLKGYLHGFGHPLSRPRDRRHVIWRSDRRGRRRASDGRSARQHVGRTNPPLGEVGSPGGLRGDLAKVGPPGGVKVTWWSRRAWRQIGYRGTRRRQAVVCHIHRQLFRETRRPFAATFPVTAAAQIEPQFGRQRSTRELPFRTLSTMRLIC